MADLDQRFAQFRRERAGWLDRWILTQRRELIDRWPGSCRARRITRDLHDFVNRSSVAALVTERVVRQLAVDASSSPLRILEICAGTGWLSQRVALAAHRLRPAGRPPDRVVATDLHPNAGHGPDDAAADVQWCVADALALPFADRAFDLVIGAHALHHFGPSEVVALLRETSRVGRRVSLFDLRRTVHGVAMVGLIAPGYSRDFVHDAIVSHRRAYRLDEMRFLVDESRRPLSVAKFLSYGMMIESTLD